MPKHAGFTLIELMIAIAIISILAAVAFPSYQSSVLKSKRTDAKSTLMDYAARQELYYSQNNTYTTEIKGNTGLGMGTADSQEGYYTMTASACSGGTIATCYSLLATATGTQVDDTDCLTLTLASTGAKTATTDYCW